nr:sensor histidine kinase [uncultured Dongia sp.]
MIGSFLQPLRHRLILLFAIVLVVPSAFGVWAAIDNFRGQVAVAHDATLRFATLASNYEANLLWQSQQIVQNLARDDQILAVLRGNADGRIHADCNDAFTRAVKPYPSYGTAVLFDLSGKAACQWDNSRVLVNVSERAWFKTVLATKAPTLSGFLVSPALKEPIISYAAPVFDVDGVLKGAISLGIRLNWLSAIGQEPGLPSTGEVTLLDHQGTVLVSSTGDGERAKNTLPEAKYMDDIIHGAARMFEAPGVDGERRLYAVNALGNNGLFVVFGVPRATVIDPLLWDLMVQIGILCLVSIAGMIAALFGARLLVTKWTEKLTDAANSMSLGNLFADTELHGAPIEIWQLGENLKAMATRIEHREGDLRDSLAQKQLMLREIHHRVKNNLQIVTSLLNLYARLPRGDVFRQAFSDLQIRINALALVHRHLYESDDLKEIDLAPFMKNLCSLLQDGSSIPSRRVKMTVSFPQLRMTGDRAVPLALLTTEILTNCFKHAFPNQGVGSIDISMTVAADGIATLSITDNGVGPKQVDKTDASITMGATLIAAFTKQLGGTLEVAGPPGTTTTIMFSVLPFVPGAQPKANADEGDVIASPSTARSSSLS